MTTAQLVAAGLSADMISNRVARGFLHRIHRGVYAVGHPNLSREGRWLAAVLACGPSAVLSYHSATALWRIRDTAATRIDVSSPTGAGRGRRGIVAHYALLHPADTTNHRGIPCTTIPRTVLDLATVLHRSALEYLIHQAEIRPGPSLRPGLDDLLARSPRHPGVAIVRGLVRDPDLGLGDGAKSRLERRFLRLCRSAGIPPPRVNFWIPLPIAAGGYEVDCCWPEQRLVVELDSRRHHATTRAFRNDRERDRDLTLAGWRVVRYTWWDVAERAESVAAEVVALLRSRAD